MCIFLAPRLAFQYKNEIGLGLPEGFSRRWPWAAGKEAEMDAALDLRPSPIAGQWYPGDPQRLAREVDGYIAAAQLPTIPGEVVAVMAPHAGHRFSGPVAGYAFAALRGLSPETVAVISPMHYPYPEPLLTTAHGAYVTPLGVIPVHRPAVEALNERLLERLNFGLARVANDPEHSLEIELPFLQRVLNAPFRLVPVMVRDQSASTAQVLGQALAEVLAGGNALLVASSDLSHYYPQKVANSLDAEMLRQVAAFDPQGVIHIEELGKGFACGRAAVASVMWAARGLGANRVQILRHATSGDVTGDYSQVVGYGAAVMTRMAMDDRPDKVVEVFNG
jgi:MEMO1 family protein